MTNPTIAAPGGKPPLPQPTAKDIYYAKLAAEGIDTSKLPGDFYEQAVKYGADPLVNPTPSGIPVAPTIPPRPAPVVNKYAPTGWRRKVSIEFDLELPSGQAVRLRRLEEDDLVRLNVFDHLDNVLPMLIDMGKMEGEERDEIIKQKVKEDPKLIDDMYSVADVITMACCVRPMVTSIPEAVMYGSPEEQADPNFVAVVHIEDIPLKDRMAIFNAAFVSEADAMKSVPQSQDSVGPVHAVQGVQLPTEPPG